MPVAISAVFVFLIAFAGSAIQAAVGFGFVILCMALFPMFLPIDQCLVTAQVGGALASLWLLFGSFRKIDLRYVAFPACFGAAGSLAGLVFLGSISTGAYMRAGRHSGGSRNMDVEVFRACKDKALPPERLCVRHSRRHSRLCLRRFCTAARTVLQLQHGQQG